MGDNQTLGGMYGMDAPQQQLQPSTQSPFDWSRLSYSGPSRATTQSEWDQMLTSMDASGGDVGARSLYGANVSNNVGLDAIAGNFSGTDSSLGLGKYGGLHWNPDGTLALTRQNPNMDGKYNLIDQTYKLSEDGKFLDAVGDPREWSHDSTWKEHGQDALKFIAASVGGYLALPLLAGAGAGAAGAPSLAQTFGAGGNLVGAAEGVGGLAGAGGGTALGTGVETFGVNPGTVETTTLGGTEGGASGLTNAQVMHVGEGVPGTVGNSIGGTMTGGQTAAYDFLSGLGINSPELASIGGSVIDGMNTIPSGSGSALDTARKWATSPVGKYVSNLISGNGGGSTLGNLAGMWSANQAYDHVRGIENKLTDMYGPDSPYAKQLRQQLERKDAAAGRRSQYGPREVELQAKLAEQTSKNLLGMRDYVRDATGYRNQMVNNGLQGLEGLFGSSGGGYTQAALDFINGRSNDNVSAPTDTAGFWDWWQNAEMGD